MSGSSQLSCARRHRCFASGEWSGSSAWRSLLHCPSIFAGLRVAISIGLVVVVISEFIGGGDGLGHYVLIERSKYDIPAMYAGILFLGLLGFVLNSVFLLVERRVLCWHYGTSGHGEH